MKRLDEKLIELETTCYIFPPTDLASIRLDERMMYAAVQVVHKTPMRTIKFVYDCWVKQSFLAKSGICFRLSGQRSRVIVEVIDANIEGFA